MPSRVANGKLSIRLYPERIEAHDEHGAVASHERSFERGEVRYDWRHYIELIERKPGALRNGAPFADMPEALQRLRAALVRRPGGDRLMADVLACVPRHGLEAVLVSVELMLESGSLSAEHVRNVLARLSQGPAPSRIDTALTLGEEPLADTARYDRLHAGADHD